MSTRNLCAAFLLSIAVNAQVLSTYFVQPPGKGTILDYTENPTYSLGSDLEIKWVTFVKSYSIYVWQQNLTASAAIEGSPIYTKSTGQDEAGTTTWTVNNQNFDLQQSNVFFLALGPNQTLTGAQTCHYFNVTAAIAKTTSPTPSTTPATSPSSNTQRPTGSTSENSPRPSETSNDHNDKPSMRLALGLGVGLGVPIILLLTGYLGWKISKAYRSSTSGTATTKAHDSAQPSWSPRRQSPALKKTELPVSYQSTQAKGQWPSEQIYHELSAGR